MGTRETVSYFLKHHQIFYNYDNKNIFVFYTNITIYKLSKYEKRI